MAEMKFKKNVRRFRKFIHDINPSASNFNSRLPIEYDNRIRDSEIWLYCRSIKCSDSSNTTQEGYPRSLLFSHWMLVFEFRDKTAAVIEGLHEEGKLIPGYSKIIEDHWCKYKMIGTKRTSPAKVRKLAFLNPFNGDPYSALSLNCQHWVKKTIELLE